MREYKKVEDVLSTYTNFWDGDEASVESKTLLGEPVIFAAVRNGDLPAIKVLLDNGANINSKGEFDNTPLHSAIQACQFSTARYLLSKGADPNIINSEGKLPKDCCWEEEWSGIFGHGNA